MDQIEKWLVDQADKFFTGLERDAVRSIATRWHNLPNDERQRLTEDRES